ncbi:PepSY domain-containing protein [Chitinimonas arctica]|uniref:PepSY domain-containing protein n=1 Tax=Chitinimonas arctica TaxID=2594795 RepID=A0A516SKX5_9NEIS|nr:PepSY domain-containing protein [Chitinimonas arctica]QDQ28806.1 PepSY domain-containing protein [Chitinimonas arctica]
MTTHTRNTRPRFYTLAWRWHFYAGLLVAPIMVILAITGLIYLYKPQLDAAMYRAEMFVSVSGRPLPAQHQLAAVRQTWPTAEVRKFTPPPGEGRSSEFLLQTPAGPLTVFVDPYRGKVLGSRDETRNLQAIAKRIHGTLLLGKSGDLLIELAASWGFLLLISGIYLWWPRNGGLGGVLYPRLRRGKYLLLRDLHVVSAFWSSLLLAFMLLSGMPWTGVWGDRFAAIWSRFPAQLWDAVPHSRPPAATLNLAAQTVPWAVEHSPLPASAGHHHEQGASAPAAQPLIPLDRIVAIATAHRLLPGYSISLPNGADGVYTISIFPSDPRDEQTLHIDQYSGQVLAKVTFQDYALLPKAVEMGVALHEGKLFGLANQLLMTLACLLVLLVAVSGIWMWWRRKPSGRLGAPAPSRHLPNWKLGMAVLGVLALIFPLLLASLLLLLLMDLLLGRLPGLRRVLN